MKQRNKKWILNKRFALHFFIKPGTITNHTISRLKALCHENFHDMFGWVLFSLNVSKQFKHVRGKKYEINPVLALSVQQTTLYQNSFRH